MRSTGSKVERANPLSAQAEAGNIKLIQGPWIGAFLDELCAFPEGAHDDQVDATSGAFAQIARRKVIRSYQG
jgi:predicted phage terminase large subunit-like protein